jgi:hypothetical protein
MGLLDDLLRQVGTLHGSPGQSAAGGASNFLALNEAFC